MNGVPDLIPWLLALLALSLVVSIAQLGVQRRWGMLLAQPALVALLAATLLWKPEQRQDPVALITDGATQAQISALRTARPSIPLFALPGAIASDEVTPVTDLAGLLRQRPASIVVVGDGLDAAELVQLGDTGIEFQASDWPSAAITQLQAPSLSAPGERWVLNGSVQQSEAGDTVSLIDPAGVSVDQSTLTKDGQFTLSAQTPLSGEFVYHVELRRGDEVLDRLPSPVRVVSTKPGKALLLASTPSPELKFLRRWAADAGLVLDSRIGIAPNLGLRRGDATLSAASLAELDLLIVDESSWKQLGGQKDLVTDAVRAGMGLLWRVIDTPTAATLAEWKALGISVDADEGLPLETAAPPFLPKLAPGTSLHRWPIRASSTQAVASPASLGSNAWTPLGQGRIGITWLIDAYQYVQQGHPDVYATHWATLWQTLSRPHRVPDAWQVIGLPVAGQRVVVCNHDQTAQDSGVELVSPDDQRLQGISDPQAAGCVGFWPRQDGAWRLQSSIGRSASDSPDSTSKSIAGVIQVFEPSEVRSLMRADRRSRTEAFALRASVDSPPTPPTVAERPRRVILLGLWLLLAWTLWWWERRTLIRSATRAEFAPATTDSAPGRDA